MTFTEKLEKQMRNRGLSARALAEALSVSNATVSGWLRGAAPRPEKLKELADYLRVPLDSLIDESRDLPFEEHLEVLRVAGEKAQAAYPDNPDAAASALDASTQAAHQKNMAQRLAGVVAELTDIARLLDPTNDHLQRLSAEVRRFDSAAEKLARLKTEAASKSEKKERKQA